MKIYNPINYHQRPKSFSKGGGINLTVPDQSLTMREIMTRFTLGQSLNADFSSTLQYMEEDEIESSLGINIKSLDLSEQHELKNFYKEKVNQKPIHPTSSSPSSFSSGDDNLGTIPPEDNV